jgi:hypothetical protein
LRGFARCCVKEALLPVSKIYSFWTVLGILFCR